MASTDLRTRVERPKTVEEGNKLMVDLDALAAESDFEERGFRPCWLCLLPDDHPVRDLISLLREQVAAGQKKSMSKVASIIDREWGLKVHQSTVRRLLTGEFRCHG